VSPARIHRSLTLFQIALAIFVFTAHVDVFAQRPSPSPTPSQDEEIDPDDVISVNTTEVLLPVTVRDAQGAIVKNLTRKESQLETSTGGCCANG
jgi:hypothetical protein